MRAIYADDLGRPLPICDVPGCIEDHGGELWFHATCHPSSPTWARYDGEALTIQCATCGLDIVALHLAARPPPGEN